MVILCGVTNYSQLKISKQEEIIMKKLFGTKKFLKFTYGASLVFFLWYLESIKVTWEVFEKFPYFHLWSLIVVYGI